jgi:hypothetical protein
MTLTKLTKAIESYEFSAFLGLANNAAMFRELVEKIPAVQQLVKELTVPASARELLTRIESLVREQDDVRFRNQRDAAVAVYVLALVKSDESLGRIAASLVLNAPRLWWARRVALDLVAGSPLDSSKERTEKSFTSEDWDTTFSMGRGENLIIVNPPSELVRDGQILNSAALTARAQDNAGSSTTNLSAGSYQITTLNPIPAGTMKI